MKEKLICIATPTERTYYRATAVAKEFLDKEKNIVHSTGALPEGEITELNVSSATVKHLAGGKLNGKLEVINLLDNTITFSEEYKDGLLVQITERMQPLPSQAAPAEKATQLYPGTILKTSKGSRSFYVNGKNVAEETVASNGVTLELLGQIPDGPVKEFDDNGQLRTEAVYQNNKLNGEILRYGDDGALLSREQYKEGLLQGPAEYYIPVKEGQMTARCFYRNSRLEGERTLTQPDGSLRQQEYYKNGRLNGERTCYYSSGKLESREQYEEGKLHGKRELFFPSGEVWYQENYVKGRLDGERFGFFATGKVHLEEFYTDGMLEGTRRVFAENGELLVFEEYHWGSLLHNTDRKHV